MKFAYHGKAEWSTYRNRQAKVVTCSDDSGKTFYLYHLIQTGCNTAYCAITVAPPGGSGGSAGQGR